jgi:alcohol-forming fatty acyl-CoA reductase
MEEISIASEAASDEQPSIGEFLAGKNIFITGGTGFLGTLIIERLLSATPKIGNVYVLIRGKNGYSAESRIERMMQKTVSRRENSA